MKTYDAEKVKFPKVYQAFKNSRAIGEVINRSESYVKKALKEGFTCREQELMNNFAKRNLFE